MSNMHSIHPAHSKKLLFLILLAGVAAFVTSCSPKNAAGKGSGDAKQDWMAEGIVVDMRGLDGCTWMIRTREGKKLQPITWAAKMPELYEGMRLLFQYEEQPDVVSTCMAEDANVTILEYAVVKPGKKECVKVLDPFRVDWMVPLMEKYKPFSIVRYDYEDGWAYLLQCGQRSYLYDCQGTFMCDVPGRMFNECMELISGLKNAEVIWVMNERK